MATILFFIAVLFIVPDLKGADSYYFIQGICHQHNYELNSLILSKYIFSVLPCNILAFKLLTSVCFLASLWLLFKTTQLIVKKNSLLANLFCFAGFILPITFFSTFEDDILGFPLLFLANYYFIKGIIQNSNKDKLISLIIVCFTGLFVWKGAIIYLIPQMFFFIPALIIFLVLLLLNGFGIIVSIFPVLQLITSPTTMIAYEEFPLIVFSFWGFLLIGFIAWFKFKENSKIKLYGILFFVMALLNSKYGVHSIVFLSTGMVILYNQLKQGFSQEKKYKALFLVLLTLAVIPVTAINYSMQFPNQTTWNAINYAQEQGRIYNKGVKGDWSMGYWLEYKGESVGKNKGSFSKQDYSDSVAIILYDADISLYKCKLLKKFEDIRTIKVYNCN